MINKIKETISRNWLGGLMLMLIASALTGNRTRTQTAFDNAVYITKTKVHNAFLSIVIMSVMSLVVGSIFLYIGIFVNTIVREAIPRGGFTAADNTTYATVTTNVNTAFSLGGIIMIVIGAAGIISVLLGMIPSSRPI